MRVGDPAGKRLGPGPIRTMVRCRSTRFISASAPGAVLSGTRRAPGQLRPRPWLHPRRVPARHGASLRPSWGYQVTGYLGAPTARPGTDDFRYLVDRLHQAGIESSSTGCPVTSGRLRARPLRRAAALRAPGPAPGPSPTGVRTSLTSAAWRCATSLVANAVYWLEEFHIDGLRVDGRLMLYLTIRGEPGSGIPNVHGGREHLEAIGLLQEANATAYKWPWAW